MSLFTYETTGERGFRHVFHVPSLRYDFVEQWAMVEWCEAFLGEGGVYPGSRWTHVQTYVFLFTEDNDALAFKMRWA